MKKFCKNCGTEIKVNEEFCSNCGEKVDEVLEEGIVDKIKNYDYKSKAEEIKDTVAGYDYKGKAKEVSETIKNFDYKGEVENVKKGGFGYILSKYKTALIAILIIVVGIWIFKGCFGSSRWVLRNLDTLEVTFEEVEKAEKKMSDSDEPYSKHPMYLSYDDVKFLGFEADLDYVQSSDGKQVAMMYEIKDVDFEKILKKIEKKLGKGEEKEDICPNYKWDDGEYKYNLIYSDGNATFVVNMK